ncbi:Non-specific serine/threonine protein kinase [Bertholletia excelsa]
MFVVEELARATGNFNKTRVLGKGVHGTIFKGMLRDGGIVAVKKSNRIDGGQVRQFINEVFILSQISHRNMVKLLGCCLETEIPLLVYEYVCNGALPDHLHGESRGSKLSWQSRLRIAGEVAGALAYLHSYASIAIYHRDIKSSNILLDENYRSVVSDFGLSRPVPNNKAHLTTMVRGTLGYLDPEYFRSGRITDKSDVYAFGVVLAELLTGKEVMPSDGSQGLVVRFKSLMKHNRLFEMVEKKLLDEAQEDEILAVAKIAQKCMKFNAKKRPNMKAVASDLNKMRREKDQPSFISSGSDPLSKIIEPPPNDTSKSVRASWDNTAFLYFNSLSQ